MINKIKRLFFNYEEIGLHRGNYKLTLNQKRNGEYYFTLKDPKLNHHLMYRYTTRKEPKNYEIFTTVSSDIYKSILEDFRREKDFPIYKFYRVKEKYCIVYRRYTDETDVWLSSITKLGMTLLLSGVFIAGSTILFFMYLILKYLFIFIFM